MNDGNEGAPDNNRSQDTEGATRPQQAGEAATTRFGMEDGDNTDVPATGLDPEQQGGVPAQTSTGASSGSQPDEDAHLRVEDEAAKLGDFA